MSSEPPSKKARNDPFLEKVSTSTTISIDKNDKNQYILYTYYPTNLLASNEAFERRVIARLSRTLAAEGHSAEHPAIRFFHKDLQDELTINGKPENFYYHSVKVQLSVNCLSKLKSYFIPVGNYRIHFMSRPTFQLQNISRFAPAMLSLKDITPDFIYPRLSKELRSHKPFVRIRRPESLTYVVICN